MADKKLGHMNGYVYDGLLWLFSILVDLFFREVHPRSSWKIPKTGPVLFVCAPHANQFVDPLILMSVVRKEAERRIHFLIAEKSMKRRFIGWAARRAGSLPVGRALDATKAAPGKIYLPDPVNDPCLVRGVGTNFDAKDFQVGGLLVLPSVNNLAASAEIQEIKGPEEIRLKRPFKGGIPLRQLTGRDDITEDGKFMNNGSEIRNGPAPDFEGINFKVAPKVDQTEVYDAVFDTLTHGGCIGIFPEGGSHDRPELLPLKAGVAIMALGALANDPDCGLKIIPVGMNYFHAHKFRSRAVIEFGTPVDVPPELVQRYKSGERREAIGTMLETIYNALVAVTVTSPDYETLMLIQAVRRLYNPKGKKLPLPMVVELNRRLVKGYTRYKDDPRIIQLKKSVLSYNKRLTALNIRDHQVEYAKLSIFKVICTLIYRLGKLVVLSVLVIPGLFLFGAVFVLGKVISIKKSKEALAASTVKIQARDVMATWKLLVAMAVAPVSYAGWIVLFTYWCHHNRIQGWVPEWVSLKLFVLVQSIVFPTITYAALRFGEIGMDIAKSLPPLIYLMVPSSNNTLVRLRATRADLAAQVTDVINTLGPEMFPDFDSARIITDPFRVDNSPPRTPGGRRQSDTFSFDSMLTSPTGDNAPVSIEGGSSAAGNLPRNESFGDLGRAEFYSTRPGTPNKSRSRTNSVGGFPGSAGFHLKAFSTLNSKDSLDTVSQKIRGAMRERHHRRRSSGADGWEMGSGATTPGSEPGKKDI
ncbi:glycerol-3-phosphate O-acyltransferase [Lepidopterella palustris CBS 459.81]|uniref:Glycerol-3-phosphate O-acyltransferase n=1 Tax=Lepidopterella palustris CBS 459.81 TaxID=1314670 RepID=A0A8E2JH00_9PEZI|nr:glycerol-3-phosphate O-acyltransferase [Lepidopterella palustris CBS 459.81]